MSDDLIERLEEMYTFYSRAGLDGSAAVEIIGAAIARIRELEDTLSLRTNLHGEAIHLIKELEAAQEVGRITVTDEMTDTDRDAVERLARGLEASMGGRDDAAASLRALLAAKERAEAERDAEILRLRGVLGEIASSQDGEGSWKAACQYRQRLARAALTQPKEGDEDDG